MYKTHETFVWSVVSIGIVESYLDNTLRVYRAVIISHSGRSAGIEIFLHMIWRIVPRICSVRIALRRSFEKRVAVYHDFCDHIRSYIVKVSNIVDPVKRELLTLSSE